MSVIRILMVAFGLALAACLAGARPDIAHATDLQVVTISPSQDARWLSQAAPGPGGNPSVLDSTLAFGYGAYEDWLSALQFNLSSVPASAAITSAELQLYYTGQCLGSYFTPCGESVPNFQAFHPIQAWSTSSVYVARDASEPVGPNEIVNRDGIVRGETSFDVYGPPRWLKIDITDLTIAWLAGSVPNYGVILDSYDGIYGGGGHFYSSRHGDPPLRPKLVVTYVANEEMLHGTDTSEGELFSYNDDPSGGEIVDGASEYVPDFQGEDANLEPSTIIGPDNRRPITGDRLRKFPNRAVVHIERISGADCSGALIGANTVATAGHCLYDFNTEVWNGIAYVAPAQDDESTRPYGSCDVVKRFVASGWKRFGAKGADYGAIKLDCNVGNRTGWFGFVRNPDNVVVGLTSIISGYPSDKPEGTQWRSVDKIRRVTTQRLYYRNDTTGGMSGSPVYRGRDAGCRWCIMGIHAYGGTESNYGPRINRFALRNLNRWKNWP
jgi:glutamyl endopeptidase